MVEEGEVRAPQIDAVAAIHRVEADAGIDRVVARAAHHAVVVAAFDYVIAETGRQDVVPGAGRDREMLDGEEGDVVTRSGILAGDRSDISVALQAERDRDVVLGLIGDDQTVGAVSAIDAAETAAGIDGDDVVAAIAENGRRGELGVDQRVIALRAAEVREPLDAADRSVLQELRDVLRQIDGHAGRQGAEIRAPEIDPCAAVDLVDAGAAVDRVVAGAARNHVVSGAGDELIGARAGRDREMLHSGERHDALKVLAGLEHPGAVAGDFRRDAFAGHEGRDQPVRAGATVHAAEAGHAVDRDAVVAALAEDGAGRELGRRENVAALRAVEVAEAFDAGDRPRLQELRRGGRQIDPDRRGLRREIGAPEVHAVAAVDLVDAAAAQDRVVPLAGRDHVVARARRDEVVARAFPVVEGDVLDPREAEIVRRAARAEEDARRPAFAGRERVEDGAVGCEDHGQPVLAGRPDHVALGFRVSDYEFGHSRSPVAAAPAVA